MQFNVRKWTIKDAVSLQVSANNIKIAKSLRDTFPYPYTLEDAFWYINYCLSQDDKESMYYAIEVDNIAIGSISLILKSDETNNKYGELGYWISENYWNKGIATKAVKIICSKGFDCFNINYILAEVFTDNIKSIKVLEKSAFINNKTNYSSVKKGEEYKDTYLFKKTR